MTSQHSSVTHKFFRWMHLPAFATMAMLFFLSGRSGSTLNSWVSLVPPMDKVAHLSAYFVLGWSFCVWIRGDRWVNGKVLHAFLVILAVGVFGISDEFHQSFVPGRTVSLEDWMADICGGLLAVGVFLAMRGYRFTDRLRLTIDGEG